MNFIKISKKDFNKVALITKQEKKITYKELYFESEKLKRSFKKRSLVFLLAGNNHETIVSYLSLLKGKCVIFFLDQNINQSYLDSLIKSYKPNYIIKGNSQILKDYSFSFSYENLSCFKQKKFTKLNLHKDLVILLTTSGSTGTKKLVRQSYKNYVSNTANIIKKLKINKKLSTITTLPISYTFGLSIINTHLSAGSKIILNEDSVLQKNFWKKFYKHKPSILYGVPYTYELFSRIGLDRIFQNGLKKIAHAGGRLSKNLFLEITKFCEKKKIKFYSMYGQSEATARISILDTKYVKRKINSIGKALPGSKFILKDENENLIKKENEPGILYYYGENVCLGYAQNYKDLKKGDENRKFINTGDIAYYDKDKFFFIVGRKKRMTKIYGHSVNLDEVEMIIEKLGFKIVCQNVDDQLILNFDNKRINKNLIKQTLVKLLKLNPRNINFNFVDKFNMNESGKIIFND